MTDAGRGCAVGAGVGRAVGRCVGGVVGLAVGMGVGAGVGAEVGRGVGAGVRRGVGTGVGPGGAGVPTGPDVGVGAPGPFCPGVPPPVVPVPAGVGVVGVGVGTTAISVADAPGDAGEDAGELEVVLLGAELAPLDPAGTFGLGTAATPPLGAPDACVPCPTATPPRPSATVARTRFTRPRARTRRARWLDVTTIRALRRTMVRSGVTPMVHGLADFRGDTQRRRHDGDISCGTAARDALEQREALPDELDAPTGHSGRESGVHERTGGQAIGSRQCQVGTEGPPTRTPPRLREPLVDGRRQGGERIQRIDDTDPDGPRPPWIREGPRSLQ